LLLFGSNVTANNAGAVFTDWPLMNGTVAPVVPGLDAAVRALYEVHALHRYVAGIVALIVWGTSIAAWRTQRARPVIVRLAVWTGVLFTVQVGIGALLVFTVLAPWVRTLHVAVGAVVWALAVALALTAWYEARLAGRTVVADAETGPGDPEAARRTRGDTVRSYIALTKPRIIELLLVTTIPAMVLATRDLPGMNVPEWFRLVFWTMLGGSLAAGSANSINQYLDRDIDLLMSRTKRRPLPANDVPPENAVVFGIVLGVVAIAMMAFFVNLLSAFLTLLAIAFYVFVYTILLKRSTPQNIVIGGAAGALPPVIGWAAVTGRIEVPALMLFALVFYWTPPHFWALALRIRKDYAAANVPMLPVVKGVPETARQIGLYTILLVAISLIFFAVARMGAVYLVAAIVLGAVFLWRAFTLWRQATSPEGSLAQAIRLYRWSISYLTLLFVAVMVDSLFVARIG
jgi:protoheme IX farnesyltransferase